MSKKTKTSFLEDFARNLEKEKISGYVSKDRLKRQIEKKVEESTKPTIDDLIEMTKELAPDAYKEIIKNHTIFEKANESKNNTNSVDHPKHYGGDTVYEVIKVIDAWNLDFNLGNAIKYIGRAGKKDPNKEVEDLEKAVWYIQNKIKSLKSER